jgi:tetratricopeptide (TPR) repeat protein
VIKGDLLYRQDKKTAAAAEYKKAVKKQAAEPYLKAAGSNQLGRYYADTGDYQRSRELYDRAIAIDPYFIEATSNKGYTYEKEGQWDKALETYRQALALNQNDTFTAVLARKAEEMIAVASDAGKKERIDRLVKDLAARYREQKKASFKTEDTWTSRPMVMTFVDFQETGGLSQRDGFSAVLTTQLGKTLDESGRVRVVDRVLLERLLEELNLGSSDLADPETALRLGKVLAAKILGTGTLYFLPNGTLINMKLIDTETSTIPKTITRQIALQTSLEKEINLLNREILKAVIQKYPLQGYIVQAEADQVMINLGSNQGVVMGTAFDVIEEKEPVKYKGKVLRGAPKTIARIEVTQVEPDLCFARITEKEKALEKDQKIRERLDQSVTTGGKK